MQIWLRRFRAYAVEAAAVVFAAGSVAELFIVSHVKERPLLVVLALFWSLPFIAYRRNQLVTLLVIVADLVVLAIVEGKDTENLSMPFIAALVTAVLFGLFTDRRLRIAGWSAIIGAAAIVDYRSTSTAADFFWTTLIFTLAWFFGVAFGNRTAQTRELRARVAAVEAERHAAAERAAAEERARIARELHDVVAHSVSVMVVQASGVRRLLSEDQEREREALLSVERIGRDALSEMRRMLGVMRTGEEQPASRVPQPSLEHLDRLVAQVEAAGLPVTLRVEGTRPELPPGIDLSAYRIVQEGLTNALRHGDGAHAEVVVRYGDVGVEVEIVDEGGEVNGEELDGQGLVGMRERVALYGGTIVAGPRADGGFMLRALLPVEAAT